MRAGRLHQATRAPTSALPLRYLSTASFAVPFQPEMATVTQVTRVLLGFAVLAAALHGELTTNVRHCLQTAEYVAGHALRLPVRPAECIMA